MTTPTTITVAGAIPDGIPAAAGLAAYRLTAGLRLADERPYMELRCPHTVGQVGRRADAHKCVTNLLNDKARVRSVPLLDLLSTAVMHDDPTPSLERTARLGALSRELGDLGSYIINAEVVYAGEDPFLCMNCPYTGGRCPGSKAGECVANIIPTDRLTSIDLGPLLQLAAAHEQARYGVPHVRLTALRDAWAARLRTEVEIRETADGPSAGLASTRADLLSQILAEFDRAVNGE